MLLLLVLAAIGTPALLRAQTPTAPQKPVAFDAASVKANTSGDLEQHIFRSSTGLTVMNMPARRCRRCQALLSGRMRSWSQCGRVARPDPHGRFSVVAGDESAERADGTHRVDRTGLSGNWEVTVTYAIEQRVQPGVEVPAPDPSAPSIFTALQEQLGLKLESTKGPVDVLVVDRIEKPTSD